VPYYTRSVKRIYAQYAAYFTRVERSLGILSLCTLDTRRMEIPSWVPDRTIDFAACPSRSLTQWYTPGLHKFAASSNRPHVGYVSRDSKVLYAWGIQCFTISALGEVLQEEHARPGSESQDMW